MAYKLSPLPPVYTEIGSLVFGETSVHADLSLTKRLVVSIADAEENYAGVSLTSSDIDRLVHFLRDMQSQMR